METLPSPFGNPAPSLSDSELRETAYEILVAACRSTGSRPLTYISQSEKSDRDSGGHAAALLPSPSLHRSLTSTAASKVKKALGMKSRKSSSGGESSGQVSQMGRVKKAATVGELVRIQMQVSEQIDSRIRRALLRIAGGQIGKRVETMVLPFELLQQIKSSDFSDQKEYQTWQRRIMKVLEAGLILNPYIPITKADSSAQQKLKQIIQSVLERPLETWKITGEEAQNLRNLVMQLAGRKYDGSSSEICHWADGFPLNLRLYQLLLESCFDLNNESSLVEEVDEVIELIKKTWIILGMNQRVHNVCFLWVLFRRYIMTGQVENDLLIAANNLIREVEIDAKESNDLEFSKVSSSVLSLIQDWADKKLNSYHDSFNIDNVELLESTVSLGISAAKVLVEDIPNEYRRRRKKQIDLGRDKIDHFIRSSLRIAFSQIKKMVEQNKRSKTRQNNLPVLEMLAEEAVHLAFNEKAIFSSILKKWHPFAAGVAMATIHSCYANELKKFISGIKELTPDAIRVLTAADKLEKDLVQIAVEDSVDSEDGGKSVIREMPPFEAESVIAHLVKSWIKTRIDRLKEWIDRNLQQEVWNPKSNKFGIAPSSVEVLRMVDETMEAFFLLPILMHSSLLPELTSGLDKCLQHFVSKTKSGCGSRNTFIPALPALTRCTVGSRRNSVFKKKEKPINPRKKSQIRASNRDDPLGILQLCCKINTLQYIRVEVESSGKKTITRVSKSDSSLLIDVSDCKGKIFEQSITSCSKGIHQLCEATAYKIVFHDLSNVLWDGLYIGDASSSRIEPFLEELERCLEIISITVTDRIRTRIITDIMRASFDAFLFVLLAGGPSRGFTLQDSDIVQEDFKFLCDLFWSNGDGLPLDLIEKVSSMVKNVLTLLRTDTESLIQRYKSVCLENFGSDRGKLPLPPAATTSGQWNPTEPNTLLRVLCYRYDEAATKFLKKTYNIPRKLT